MEHTKRILDVLDDLCKGSWSEKPALYESEGTWTKELFGSDAIKNLFTDARIPEGCFRIIKNGNFEPHRPYSRPIVVGESVATYILDGTKATLALREGSSIIISALEEFWKPINLLCSSLSKRLGTKCSAFTVITPPGERGFLPHIDRTEQLVIQCQGKKTWKVFDIYIRGKGGPPVDLDKVGIPILELELSQGQILYLPQGAPHMAYTTETLSSHITLTFEGITIGSWIKSAIDELLYEDEDLLKALNPFWFENESSYIESAKDKCERIKEALSSKTMEIALKKINHYNEQKIK